MPQALLNATSFAASGASLKGRSKAFGVWVKCSTASVARVRMYDGVTSTATGYHTGDGTWQFLGAAHVISSSATELTLLLEVKNSSGDAYFSGASALPGLVPLTDWVPCPKVYGTIFFPISGTVALATDISNFPFARPALVKDTELYAKTAPTGQALIVDITRWATSTFQSMYTTKPQLATGAKSGSAKPDGTYRYRCLAGGNGMSIANRLISFDVTQIGSSVAGADLRVMIRALQYARPQESLLAAEDGF
jgi:hypothetical protein